MAILLPSLTINYTYSEVQRRREVANKLFILSTSALLGWKAKEMTFIDGKRSKERHHRPEILIPASVSMGSCWYLEGEVLTSALMIFTSTTSRKRCGWSWSLLLTRARPPDQGKVTLHCLLMKETRCSSTEESAKTWNATTTPSFSWGFTPR